MAGFASIKTDTVQGTLFVFQRPVSRTNFNKKKIHTPHHTLPRHFPAVHLRECYGSG